jgi:hypothetical protein
MTSVLYYSNGIESMKYISFVFLLIFNFLMIVFFYG